MTDMIETITIDSPVTVATAAKAPTPDFGSVASDKAAMEAGVPVMVDEDRWVLVAHNSCKAYQDIVKRLRKPYEKLLSVGGKIPDDVAKDINIRAAAEGLLVGWGGFTDTEGNELPYTAEFGLALLREAEDVREKVIGTAFTTENYRRVAVDAAKNAFASWRDGRASGAATQS